MPQPNIQKSTVLFYDNDSNKAMAIKLNEYVAATEKRIAELEKRAIEQDARITDLEIKL